MLFKTKRLIIRPFQKNDQYFVQLLYTNPEVRKYMTDGNPIPEEKIDEDFALILEENEKHPGLGRFAVYHNEDFIGQALLYFWDDDPRCELGYALLPRYWGKGFGIELASGILKYALDEIGLTELVATVHRENQTSIKILKALGFKFKEIARKYGREKDLYVFNI